MNADAVFLSPLSITISRKIHEIPLPIDKEVVYGMVLPGVDEVNASLELRVSMFMRLDFPTLERPIKAYSGSPSCGQRAMSVLLMTKVAVFISISSDEKRKKNC